MQCSIVHPSELGGTEFALWRQFVQQAGVGSPFLTPTYTTVIAAHRPESRVATLFDGPDLVGFLPYECSPERVGLPIGGGTNDVQALIAGSDFECDLPDLVRRLKVREWRFDHLLPGQELFVPFHREIHRSPVVDLSDGYDAYTLAVRQKSAGVLPKTARQRRQLAKEVGPVSTEWRSTRPEDLDLLIALKVAQYERTGAFDVFGAAWSRDAVRHFSELVEGECSGIMSALRAGDRTDRVALRSHQRIVAPLLVPGLRPAVRQVLARSHPAPRSGGCRGRTRHRHDRSRDGHTGVQAARVANTGYEVASGRVPARGPAYRAALLARHPAWLGRRIRRVTQEVRSATSRRSGA